MREQPAGAEERGRLVLDEGPEALAHQDKREHRVAPLLEPFDEPLLQLVENRRLEIALLDASGVDQHQRVHAQRGDRRQHLAQRLGPRDRQQELQPRPRGWRLRELRPQHQLRFVEAQHLGGAGEAAEPPRAQEGGLLRAQDELRVREPAAAEARRAVLEEVLVSQEEQVHAATLYCWPRERYYRRVRVLQHRITGPETCPYLPGPSSPNESLVMTGISPARVEQP